MRKFNNNYSNKNIGEIITLKGWVAKVRNLGGLIFIDLRDRSGIMQVVIRPENKFYSCAENLKNEYIIEVTGQMVERENKNNNIINGDIELEVVDLKIINTSELLPFEINEKSNVNEETGLKYRYLEFRKNNIKNNIIRRHKIVTLIREYLNNNEFIEIETPILTKSTPEGARDYLVPSRLFNGSFYALPQSPQLFKQLLMVGGMDRYYQIARCFRDEDLRADRQPEFTQIDIEMSFVEVEDIINLTENMFVKLFKEILNKDIIINFPRIKYIDAINLYGSDKPDTRFELKIKDITNVFKQSEFKIFKDNITSNGIINCLVIDKLLSRNEIEKLGEYLKKYKLNNLFWLKYQNNEFSGSIVKQLTNTEFNDLKESLNLNNDSLILIVNGKYENVKQGLGALRLKLGQDLNLIDESRYDMLWVVDFPLFEYDEKEKRYYAAHHPFTSPINTELSYLDKPSECLAKAYDLVLNGYEIGGGSIRIHNSSLQKKMFETLGLSKNEVEDKFKFLLDAFKYGTPPHGGIALGLERLCMIFCNTNNIKDVIAFPKTATASCLMTEAPNIVSTNQLDELGISIINNDRDEE